MQIPATLSLHVFSGVCKKAPGGKTRKEHAENTVSLRCSQGRSRRRTWTVSFMFTVLVRTASQLHNFTSESKKRVTCATELFGTLMDLHFFAVGTLG